MTNAIIMASGLGTRLRPITNTIPKPLVTVANTPLIETVIQALISRKVDNIYVVVGYLANKFEYLKDKYKNLCLVYNPDYEKVNNISSVYYAKEVLKQGNCFICEADLFVKNNNFLNRDLQCSGYFGKFIEGFSNDWVFDTNEEDFISRIGKNGENCFNMVGFSYFVDKDAQILAEKLTEAYHKDGYEKLFWDEVVNKNLESLKLKVFPIGKNDIFEIDTIQDLNAMNGVLENGR